MIVVDDSIVRGTTTPRVVKMLRDAGATEIHMRVTSPPITHPCFYGVDMATRSELIASQSSIEGIRDHIGADTLGYFSLEGTVSAANTESGSHCDACFTGNYPSPVPLQLDKLAFEPDIGDVHDRHALPILKSR